MKSVTEYYHYIKTEKEKTEGINYEIDNLNKELNILQNKLFQEARCISKKPWRFFKSSKPLSWYAQ